jgi:DNA modification methylase
MNIDQFTKSVKSFSEFHRKTEEITHSSLNASIPVYINEFWTSKQRAAHSLHEISYRACFKPQLPRFFISRLTEPGDRVYDPFMGRGTTLIEAALMNRTPMGCDINPLSQIMIKPRLNPPEYADIRRRLQTIELAKTEIWEELLVFYHPDTLQEISGLRNYLVERSAEGKLDEADAWIRMVATNRLTGHSKGFFSVYSLPPNQAVSIDSQRKINEKRNQTPPYRDIREIMLKKSADLLEKIIPDDRAILAGQITNSVLLTESADDTAQITSNSIRLVVTSPPFLNIVNYQTDNWLRCWFNDIDSQKVQIWQIRKPASWQAQMTKVFAELNRILQPGGLVAFEVGEVLKGSIFMETLVVPAAMDAGLTPVMLIINDQCFTKTSNCWGVDNLAKGTNSNRIVLLQKPN